MSYGLCNLPKNGCMMTGKGIFPINHNNYSNVTTGTGIIKTVNNSVSNNIPSQHDMAQLANKLNNVHIRNGNNRKKKYVNLKV